MQEGYVLAFDVGTQSVRALLIDRFGVAAASVKETYEEPYYSREPNWAEQRPDFYYETICSAARKLKAKAPEAFSQAVCVAPTVFRNSAVCLDKERKPLRDCILWLDRRRVQNPPKLAWWRRVMFAAVGMTDTVNMLRHYSVINWMQEKEPETWAKTDKYVMLSTYLNMRLSGRLADSYAGILGLLPVNYKRRKWDKYGVTRCLYDLPQSMLSDMIPSGEVLGGITAETAALSGIPEGLPVIVTGSDKGCETIGLSVLKKDQAALSFGTACSIEFTTNKYFEPRTFIPGYPAVPNDLYNGEVQLWRGYWMLTWFKQQFAQPDVEEAERNGCTAEELLDRRLGDVPPGSNGLMVLPYWTPGLDTPDARGAMIGFSDVHTRYHVYRAIVEGLNFGLMDGMYRMERRSGQKIRRLYLGGGGSKSDAVCQITANMFGLPVSRIQTEDSCALGAAVCAFVSRGVYGSYQEAVDAMVHIRDTFQPDMNEHAYYKRLYQRVYRRYYSTVRPLHRALNDLNRPG